MREKGRATDSEKEGGRKRVYIISPICWFIPQTVAMARYSSGCRKSIVVSHTYGRVEALAPSSAAFPSTLAGRSLEVVQLGLELALDL